MIRIGIIGAGKIAHKMARTISQVNKATGYAIASRNLSNARTFAEDYGFENAYGSYQELVEDPKVDLVYIATPHSFHYEHAKLALNHGKHVLCEKPFTINENQLRELILLANSKNLTLIEGIWERYMPLHFKLKQQLDEGIIGEIQAIQANLCYHIESIERMSSPTLGGGALLDLGVYPIHFSLSILGNNYDSIQSKIIFSPTGVDRHTSITLTYPTGQMAQIFTSMGTGIHNDVTIMGTNGIIRLNSSNHIDQYRIYDAHNNLLNSYDRPFDEGGFEFELIETLNCIEQNLIESPIVTHQDSLAAMRVMDQVRYQNDFYYPGETNE